MAVAGTDILTLDGVCRGEAGPSQKCREVPGGLEFEKQAKDYGPYFLKSLFLPVPSTACKTLRTG